VKAGYFILLVSLSFSGYSQSYFDILDSVYVGQIIQLPKYHVQFEKWASLFAKKGTFLIAIFRTLLFTIYSLR